MWYSLKIYLLIVNFILVWIELSNEKFTDNKDIVVPMQTTDMNEEA